MTSWVAPGLGITALEIVKRSPKSCTGADLDPKAAEIVTERIGAANKPNYRVVNASAQETGLPSESYDAVVGEAMLTMQTDKRTSWRSCVRGSPPLAVRVATTLFTRYVADSRITCAPS